MRLQVLRPSLRFVVAHRRTVCIDDFDMFWVWSDFSDHGVERMLYKRIGMLDSPRDGGVYYTAFCFYTFNSGTEKTTVRRKRRHDAVKQVFRMAKLIAIKAATEGTRPSYANTFTMAELYRNYTHLEFVTLAGWRF